MASYADITILLDRSGSMSTLNYSNLQREDAIKTDDDLVKHSTTNGKA